MTVHWWQDPRLNRGSTLTGGVLAGVSQVHCDASRDHTWLVNDVFVGGLTLRHPLGVEEGEVPTSISSMKGQQMPSRISNPELRDLGPADDACQLGLGRANPMFQAGPSSMRRGEPSKQIRGSSASSGHAIGADGKQKGSTSGRMGAVPGARRIDRSAVSMERSVTCWYPTGSLRWNPET